MPSVPIKPLYCLYLNQVDIGRKSEDLAAEDSR